MKRLKHIPTQTSKEWIKANLLNKWYNSALTILFIAIVGVLAFFGLRFLLFTGNWEPVRQNLTLFMIGNFPRDQEWRILAQILLIAFAIGLIGGLYVSAPNKITSSIKSKPFYKRYWAIGLLIAILLILTQTILPLLFIFIGFASFTLAFWIGKLTPLPLRLLTQYFSFLAFIVSFQILSGTNGRAWILTAALTGVFIYRYVSSLKAEPPFWGKLVAAVVGGAAIYGIYLLPFIRFAGVGWEKWSGFHLNLVATIMALILAFPLGILLALGRRSKLPAIKYISVSYIELIRGVPLIALLFIGDFFLGFFVNQADSLSDITRAIIMMAIFTSAYLAEIFRGGLRAVAGGQIDASKAIGLGSVKSFIWVIFPQTLRAVIPSLVGQSISLFKDTSLLTIISIIEILRVRKIVFAQEEFIGVGIAETLIFVSFAFWAISYTMSRESQQLETKLGVNI